MANSFQSSDIFRACLPKNKHFSLKRTNHKKEKKMSEALSCLKSRREEPEFERSCVRQLPLKCNGSWPPGYPKFLSNNFARANSHTPKGLASPYSDALAKRVAHSET